MLIQRTKRRRLFWNKMRCAEKLPAFNQLRIKGIDSHVLVTTVAFVESIIGLIFIICYKMCNDYHSACNYQGNLQWTPVLGSGRYGLYMAPDQQDMQGSVVVGSGCDIQFTVIDGKEAGLAIRLRVIA